MKIAIVGCGSKKAKGRHEAKDLYISQYFDLKKRYAQEKCDAWFIISAEHGIIEPSKEISNYDTHIDDVDELKVDLPEEVLQADELVLLAGKKYRAVLRKNIPSYVEEFNPFRDTSGIGKQIAWLKKQVETSQKNLEQVI